MNNSLTKSFGHTLYRIVRYLETVFAFELFFVKIKIIVIDIILFKINLKHKM